MRTQAQIQSHIDYLAGEILKGRVVLFVGAGFSKNAVPRSGKSARMLGWDDLKMRFAGELGWAQSRTDRVSAPRLIQMYESEFGRDRRNQILRDAIPDGDMEPGPLHSRLVKFPWNAIVTTNIDTLIERTYIQNGLEYSPVIFEGDLAKMTATPIYKVHGSIEVQHTWIFSEREYHQEVKPLFIDKLRTIFAEKTVLFLGYGVNDPDLDSILYFIQNRMGHYQRRSFLLYPEEADVDRSYWGQRNIELITNRDLELLGSSSQPRMDTEDSVHASLIESFLGHLEEATDSNLISDGRQTRSLWKETRLIPAIQRVAGEQYRIIRDFLREPLIERRDLCAFRTQLHALASENTKAEALNLKVKAASVCRAVKELLSLRHKDELRQASLSVDELIFGLDTESQDYGMLALLPIGIAVAPRDPQLYAQIFETLQRLVEAAWNRLSAGYLHGLNDETLTAMLILSFWLWRSKDRTKEAPSPETLWYDLFVLRHITGGGIPEEKLYRRLKRLGRSDWVSPQKKAYVEYRKAIACLYTNRWRELPVLLAKADDLPGWKKEWTAFLNCELGDYEAAEGIYSELKERGGSRKIRYVAMQAELVARRLGRYGHYAYSREESALRQKNFEEQARMETDASTQGEYIGDFDFLRNQASKLQTKLLQTAFHSLKRDRDARRMKIWHFSASSPVAQPHNTVLQWALNGMPLDPLRTKEIWEVLNVVVGKAESLPDLIELQPVLSPPDDFWAEDIATRMAVLAWKRPKIWVQMQRDILDHYSRFIDFLLEKLRLLRGTSPLLKRLNLLSGLVNCGLRFFSRPSLERTKVLIRKVCSDSRLLDSSGQSDGAIAIGVGVAALLSKAPQDKVVTLLTAVPVDFYFGSVGQAFLARLRQSLNCYVWRRLPDDYRQQILQILERRLPENPKDCLHVLFFVQGEETKDHPLLAVFERGMQAYSDATTGDEKLQANKRELLGYYRRILEEVRSRPRPAEQYEDLATWINQKEMEGLKSQKRLSLRGLRDFLGEEIPEEHRPRIEKIINTVLEQNPPELHRQAKSWPMLDEGPYPLIGDYYLVTDQFDKYLRLWERLGIVQQSLLQWKHFHEHIQRMRKAEEDAADEVSFSDRLASLYLRCPEPERLAILSLIFNLHHSMNRVLSSDVRFFRFLWADPFIRSAKIEIPLELTLRILSLDAQSLSDDDLRLFLYILLYTDELVILPQRARTIQRLLEATKSTWQSDAHLKEKAEETLNKIILLDFHQASAG